MRLMLFRHAKSDWGDPGLPDIDRPLNSRGKAAARRMGKYLSENGLFPKLILCSTSLRTRETLSRILPFQPQETQIQLLSDVYDQGDVGYSALIRKHGGKVHSLMIIGHNPGTGQTAEELCGTGDPEVLADMHMKYPTAALAVIDFDIPDWRDLKVRTGHLDRFIKPRDFAEANDD